MAGLKKGDGLGLMTTARAATFIGQRSVPCLLNYASTLTLRHYQMACHSRGRGSIWLSISQPHQCQMGHHPPIPKPHRPNPKPTPPHHTTFTVQPDPLNSLDQTT